MADDLNEEFVTLLRTQLQDELDSLLHGDDAGIDAQKTVQLDQQAVGRLSRMDAMQQQAMAKANARRRAARRQRIVVALERMANGEFGYCEDCGDQISTKRLELDATVPKCVSCATG